MTHALLKAAQAIGFTQSSSELTGGFLCTLAASKPAGRFLELGTGVGAASAQLLRGMDAASSLVTVERNAEQVAVAKKHLGSDPRVSFWIGDGLEFLRQPNEPFDVIFADALPGKITQPELALDLVAPGGFYIVDDMKLGWTAERDLTDISETTLELWQGQRDLILLLEARADFHCTRLEWSTGLLVCVKKGV